MTQKEGILMKYRILFTTILLTLALSLPVFAATATTGISNVEYRTADEILTMYHAMNLSETVDATFSVNPDLAGLTTSGALSTATQKNALDTLNFARYIAGLSYDVTINETYAQNSQDGALALAALGGGADHYINQPNGMSDSMFASASLGTTKGNLSAGIDNLATNIIHGWLSDEGINNQYALGHRRYILSPMTETGFGLVNADSSARYGVYTAMSTQGASYGGDTVGVVWPAQTMPVEYFKSNYPWSYTYGSPVGTNVSVTITREGDGETWTMKDDFINGSTGDGFICVNNDYYGQPGCVIFTPDNITYASGDVYHVEISSNTVNASYSVSFFSLSDNGGTQDTTVPDETTTQEETSDVVSDSDDLSGASDWAQAELSEAMEAGYPVALYNDQFTQAMTRGEFAHMLGLFCNMKWPMNDDFSTTAFTDLGSDPENAERNKYIIILSQWGVINGTSDTTFAPDETITREAIAKLLLAVKNLTLNVDITQDISGYADASSVSSWALEGVRYMNQIGVLNGTNENRLNPQGDITVEQAALMCYRFFQ